MHVYNVLGVFCFQCSNGNKQRTSFCVGDGKSKYQAILGGINNDAYGNKHGPCMCDSNNMCGGCKSTNVVEIYPVIPPKLSGPLPCARLRNDDGSKAHGNHYLTTVWGDKNFGMR